MKFNKLSNLIEGGNAVGEVSRVKKSDIEPTINAFKKEVLDKVGIRDFGPIGSVGKKESSGDLDIGVEVSKDFDHKDLHKKLSDFGYTVSNASPTTMSIRYPIHNQEGKTKEWAQIDLMFGKRNWLEFGYWAPGETESKYSGAHRNMLLAAIIRYSREMSGKSGKTWAIDYNKGISRKTRTTVINKNTGKEQEKVLSKTHVTDDPDKVVNLLNIATNGNWTKKDLTTSFEKLWKKTKEVFPKDVLEKIRKYTEDAVNISKKEVPTMEQMLYNIKKEIE